MLEVHACIAEDSQNFGHLIDHLVQTFRNDQALLEKLVFLNTILSTYAKFEFLSFLLFSNVKTLNAYV